MKFVAALIVTYGFAAFCVWCAYKLILEDHWILALFFLLASLGGCLSTIKTDKN